MTSCIYYDKLVAMKDDLLNRLNDVSSEEIDKREHEQASLSQLMVEFETLIRCAIIAVNNSNRYVKFKWQKSLRIGKIDVLKMTGDYKLLDEEQRRRILSDYNNLLEFITWNREFRFELYKAIEADHLMKVNRIDELRDNTIDSHLDIATNTPDSNIIQTRPYRRENQPLSAKDNLLNKSKMVTKNLIKGNQVLQSGVLQSDLNLDELKQQTNSLGKVEEKYSQFEMIFNKTSVLVKSLEKSSNQEKRDVYLALSFLILCVSWVLWRRVFKLPVKLCIWLTFKFFKGILLSIGLVKRAPVITNGTLSSVVSTTATVTESTITQTTIESIEQAVDEAMSRILAHDEL